MLEVQHLQVFYGDVQAPFLPSPSREGEGGGEGGSLALAYGTKTLEA